MSKSVKSLSSLFETEWHEQFTHDLSKLLWKISNSREVFFNFLNFFYRFSLFSPFVCPLANCSHCSSLSCSFLKKDMSNLLSSLVTKESWELITPNALYKRMKEQKIKSVISCKQITLTLTKNQWITQKTKEQIPTPVVDRATSTCPNHCTMEVKAFPTKLDIIKKRMPLSQSSAGWCPSSPLQPEVPTVFCYLISCWSSTTWSPDSPLLPDVLLVLCCLHQICPPL